MAEWTVALALPLAIWIVASGFDDLLVDFLFLLSPNSKRSNLRLAQEEKNLAIFVPLWHEHRVIRQMVEHNLGAIRYRNYHFFLGAYPNDQPTIDVIEDLAARHDHVHSAICPHGGPTSKADCLNWIYQRMLLWEEENNLHFDAVLTHDAEDLIHPESLTIMNAGLDEHDMIQVPVLPLATPVSQLTHGVYCDEFAEYLTKDIPARQALGGFIPSNGVGTGFSRRALNKLAETESNRIFEPGCLTEDYENGFRLSALGCRQLFFPIRLKQGQPIATRGYFPKTLRTAIRQRTRWVTGIVFQGWERHGWRGGVRQLYWHWRDRKGVICNPASLLSNVMFMMGMLTWLGARLTGHPWTFGSRMSVAMGVLLPLTISLLVWRTGFRIACVACIYGIRFALGVPIRAVWGNWINSAACFNALLRYARARIRREPLVWVKTEHQYPSRAALVEHRRRLGEILVMSQYLAADDLEKALASKPRDVRIGEHLVTLGLISEEDLYEALSLQQSLPHAVLQYRDTPPAIWRTLPARVVREWKVLPFKVMSGSLFVAGPEPPSDDMEHALRRFTRLEIRFHLITPTNFEELAERVLN